MRVRLQEAPPTSSTSTSVSAPQPAHDIRSLWVLKPIGDLSLKPFCRCLVGAFVEVAVNVKDRPYGGVAESVSYHPWGAHPGR